MAEEHDFPRYGDDVFVETLATIVLVGDYEKGAFERAKDILAASGFFDAIDQTIGFAEGHLDEEGLLGKLLLRSV